MLSEPATVLVIEDDVDFRDVLVTFLEREALQIVVAEDALEAERLIEHMPPPALVLLEPALRYENGFELLARIRASETWREVPVLMLTAVTTEEEIERAFEAGANDYVPKPIQPAELLERIRHYLQTPA